MGELVALINKNVLRILSRLCSKRLPYNQNTWQICGIHSALSTPSTQSSVLQHTCCIATVRYGDDGRAASKHEDSIGNKQRRLMLVRPQLNLSANGNEMTNESGDGVRWVEEGPEGFPVPGVECT